MIYMALFPQHCGSTKNHFFPTKPETTMDTPPPLRREPTSGRRHLHRTPPFQFLNSDAFAIFFLIIYLCFIFIVLISPFYSFSFNFFKPQFTRKSLDLLSLAMILFAIACGLMSKNNGEKRAHEEIYRAPNTSNDSQFIHKSNPSLSIPNQWKGYADLTDQILLHHPPAVAGVEYWKLSSEDYITNYQALNSDSVQHCCNFKDFEDGFDLKRGKFSVYDDEISSSSSALFQSFVPPLMAPSLFSSRPVINPPPHAVVEAKLDESFESPLLRLDCQELEDEISKKEKQESKGNKKNKKKNKVKKKWQKGIGNSSPPPAPPPMPPPTVAVHHHRASSKIGEMRRDFPPPPKFPPENSNALRTHRNISGGEPPPSSAEELETKKTKIGMFCGSPDVNSKADNFIERFRAGLKLEMMNSVKERQMRTRTSLLGRKGPEQ